MNYDECLDYLNRLGNEVLTMKFGLETIRRLLQALGSPQQRFRSVLVAGTNGKGSVARYLAAMAGRAGIHTGLYTSPHLVHLTERIRIDGKEVDRQFFADCFSETAEAAKRLGLAPHPTFFEMVTAAAFLCFSRQEIDLAVLEIGMGGRLDSTNAVEPLVSVITRVDYDHQQYLGETLSLIAREKAGIMRRGRPVFSAPQLPEAAAALELAALETGAQLEFVSVDGLEQWVNPQGRWGFRHGDLEVQLRACGQFQVQNAVLAMTAALELGRRGFEIGLEAIRTALNETEFKAVLWRISEDPAIIIDGGHNPGAARVLAEYLDRFTPRPRSLVLGMMKDKDRRQVCDLLTPLFDRVFLTAIDSPRASSPGDLLEFCPCGIPVHSPSEAYRTALSGSRTTVVAGSFFLAGEIIRRENPGSQQDPGQNP